MKQNYWIWKTWESEKELENEMFGLHEIVNWNDESVSKNEQSESDLQTEQSRHFTQMMFIWICRMLIWEK